MSSSYGDAWLSLLYDLPIDVRISEVPPEIRRVHGIDSKAYMVVRNTDIIFPEEVGFLKESGITHTKKRPIRADGSPMSDEDMMVPGGYFDVELEWRVFQVCPAIKEMGKKYTDGINEIDFTPGNLEAKMSSWKSNFMRILEGTKIPKNLIDINRVYWKLATGSFSF